MTCKHIFLRGPCTTKPRGRKIYCAKHTPKESVYVDCESLFWAIWRHPYLLQHIYAQIRGRDARKAAIYGSVEAFKYSQLENYGLDVMDIAAQNGHLELVRWLHENRSEGCTEWAMDDAAAYGHLEVVKFLHENRSEGCTTDAMNEAAANGHLEVVKWLHENRDEGCTTDAMDFAAGVGHLKVLKWLHKNRNEGCTEWALRWAEDNNHNKIVNWLLAHSDIISLSGDIENIWPFRGGKVSTRESK